MRENCGFVVLCGGKSSRMGGRNKALMEVDGVTFLKRLESVAAGFPEKLISTNDPKLADNTGFVPVADLFVDSGPMSGIYSALMNAKSDAVLTTPCDVPEFSSGLAEFMLESMPGDADALICVDSTGRKHPLCGIYRKSCLKVLEEHLSASKLKIMGMLSQLNTVYLDVSQRFDDSVFSNINTPEELKAYADSRRGKANA